jgi:biopolymer transport protein ExbD
LSKSRDERLTKTMHFRRRSKKRIEVTIIPMIDILLILLIFFIVSTNFKKPRDILRIEIPTVKEIPSDTVADARSVIAVDALGNVSLDSLSVPEGLLQSYLAAYQKQNPGRKLELEADKKLPLERLLQVWEALTKAGIPIKDVPARIKLPEKKE